MIGLPGKAGCLQHAFQWTDNVELPQIARIWNEAVPHELTHHFTGDIEMPYWAVEGIAEYVSNRINNKPMLCGAAERISLENFRGENIPQYESAACFWKMLEDNNPGFVSRALSLLRSNQGIGQSLEMKFFELLQPLVNENLMNFAVGNFQLSRERMQRDYNCRMLNRCDNTPTPPTTPISR